jgi:hypothetical protein
MSMLSPFVLAFAFLSDIPAAGAAGQTETSIRVQDDADGCFHHVSRHYEWKRTEGGFTRGTAAVSQAEIDSLRKQILASSGSRDDLLARIGITPASIAAHRDVILETSWPEAHRPKAAPLEIPSELEPLLTYESLAPHILAELTGRNWKSTTHLRLRIEIPGDPGITIQSEGLVPWKLPWRIEAGGKSWESCDLELSRSLKRLVDPQGPNVELLDGTRYWSEGFWKNEEFWSRFVGAALDSALSGQQYSRLEGYLEAMDWCRVDQAMSGHINMQPESLFLEISTRYPSLLDTARWYNPLKDGQPTYSWRDFTATYDAALRQVGTQTWLEEWKNAGPDRTLELNSAGRAGFADTHRERFVVPPWNDAKFHGEPEFEVHLRRKGQWCGTVWLSGAERGALIETAHSEPGDHWFDKLEFSFHLNQPTYGRVDASGQFELRTISK